MIKKHAILIGILLALIFLCVAAFYYPGGSQANPDSIGYDWKNNYLCNLFSKNAVNGANNPSRNLAIVGMLFLCASMALFFIRFSAKITPKTPANIIKYSGVGSMLFAFLVITPYHDFTMTVASICALVALFYITVFILKSKLVFFKILSVLCLSILYANNYIYYSQQFISILPIMQKVSFVFIIGWMLGLEYFTTKEDYHLKKIPVK